MCAIYGAKQRAKPALKYSENFGGKDRDPLHLPRQQPFQRLLFALQPVNRLRLLPVFVHRQQGVDTSIARIFNTYGARMRPHDGRAIPTFLRQALDNKPVTVFGDGSQTRSFCYVDDLVRGLHALALSEEHLPVNLGNPEERSLLELAELVVRLTGASSEIVFEALPVDDPQVRRPDITRARQVLDWEPEVLLEEGLRRTIGSITTRHMEVAGA